MRVRFGLRSRRKKVGLLGGSFNPAHAGHRHLSLKAMRLLRLDEVWWLVAPLNPFKQAKDMAEYGTRLETARKVANHRKIIVSDFENRVGTRKSVDTIEALQKAYPDTDFVWLVGADILTELHRWYKYETLMRLLPVAIFARGNYALKGLRSKAARRFAAYRANEACAGSLARMKPPAWVYLKIGRHAASSTAIRKKNKLLTE